MSDIVNLSDEGSDGAENTLSYILPLSVGPPYSLSLVAFRDSETALNNPLCKRICQSLMGKLHSLWNKQSRSVVISDRIKETLGGLFVVPNATRWNATYDAMVRY